MADLQLERRHAVQPEAPRPLGPWPATRRSRALLPAGGGGDGHLPHRGGGPTRNRRLPPPAGAGERAPQRRLASHRAQDGHRDRQDRGNGHARRLADHQQGLHAKGCPVRQALPGGHAGDHHPGSPRGAAPRTGRQLLPGARSRPSRSLGSAAPGPGGDRQLPHVPAPGRQGDPGRGQQHPQAVTGAQARRRRCLPGDAGHGGSAGPARLWHGEGGDRRPQRRGPPLLPGQAARAPRRRGRGGQGNGTATPGCGFAAW